MGEYKEIYNGKKNINRSIFKNRYNQGSGKADFKPCIEATALKDKAVTEIADMLLKK